MNVDSMKNLFLKSKSNKNWFIAISSFVLFAAVYGFLIFQSSKHTIAITIDGDKKEVVTNADTIEELLKELKVEHDSKDYVYPALDKELTNNMKVIWMPAKQVEIVLGNESNMVWTTATTVEQLLEDEAIELSQFDQVSPALTDSIVKNTKVVVEPAFSLTLIDGGVEQEVLTTSITVANFLKQHKITIGNLDRVKPSLEAVIKPEDIINIIRVEEATEEVEELLDYTVVTRKDSSLTKGTEKVLQEGQKGTVSKTYDIVRENGKEVSRTLVKEDIITESVDKIVAVGSKTITAQASRGSSEAGEEFYVSSTAYTASCNGCSGRTATGINLYENPGMKIIAVDPSVIPLGTRVYVDGYGYALAADTGSAIKGNKIDVFVASKEEAYRWGRRQVKIKILD
ncbi:ubiquitin-like domain-containing protein [Bacillus spongiae]|uniref:Ubiquitin-like domain-containing protein n=1 Tax=Bacillus spongiae TaxID=2683610 RepID=A0ABU8HKI8_9BACI